MPNESSALHGITVGLPQDAEYDAVYAAVTATERGRWFLTEFANRNRHADTDLVVSAIARIEAAVPVNPMVRESVRGPTVGAAAERISDIAFKLRERAVDAGLCDALDAAVREIYDACVLPAAGRRDESGADRDIDRGSDSVSFEFELQDDKKFAAAAAQLAASLTSLGEDSQTARESQERSVAPLVQDREVASDPRTAEPADRSARWYIAPPDFYFPAPERNANGRGHDGELTGQSGEAHPLLPGPELPAGPKDDPADLFEPAPENSMSAPPPPAVAMPAPASAAACEPPPLRIAAASAIRTATRPVPSDPLAALRALSDDELIALFG